MNDKINWKERVFKKLKVENDENAKTFLTWLVNQTAQNFLPKKDMLFLGHVLFEHKHKKFFEAYYKKWKSELLEGFALMFIKSTIEEFKKAHPIEEDPITKKWH